MVESETVNKIKEEIRMISSRLGNIEFTYRDPVKNFDRTKVKGVVAKLIRVKDSSTMTALEVIAHHIMLLFILQILAFIVVNFIN